METSQPWTMESSWNARVIGPIEEQAWLDQAADYVMELARPLLEMPQAEKVMDFLHGRWLGHDQVRHLVGDLATDEHDAVLQEAGVDVVGSLASAGVLDDDRYQHEGHLRNPIGRFRGAPSVMARKVVKRATVRMAS